VCFALSVAEDPGRRGGRSRPAHKDKGPGFALDQYVKVAVGTYAMNAALLHYAALGRVTDRSRQESYGYEVDIDGSS
jgi:hypothetical protein